MLKIRLHRYSYFSDAQNKQEIESYYWLYIRNSVAASSDSFCLITSQIVDIFENKMANISDHTCRVVTINLIHCYFTVPVKPADMEIYVSDVIDVPGNQVGSEVTLIHGKTYYVDCLIKEATPAPTITAAISTASALTVEANSEFPDTTNDNVMTAIQTAKRFSFLANIDAHCGQMLTCTGYNKANELVFNYDSSTAVNQDKMVNIVVHRKYLVEG